jgi:hypothetical protein
MEKEKQEIKLARLKDGNFVLFVIDDVKVGDYFLDRGYENMLICTRDSIGVFRKVIRTTYLDAYGQIPSGLSLSEMRELVSEVDVYKKAELIAKSLHDKSKHDDYSIYEQIVCEDAQTIELGYNQALEDNKEKKYTEEDMLNAFREGTNAGALHERLSDYDNGDYEDAEEYSEHSEQSFIKSIQTKTEWEVEFNNDGKLKLK